MSLPIPPGDRRDFMYVCCMSVSPHGDVIAAIRRVAMREPNVIVSPQYRRESATSALSNEGVLFRDSVTSRCGHAAIPLRVATIRWRNDR